MAQINNIEMPDIDFRPVITTEVKAGETADKQQVVRGYFLHCQMPKGSVGNKDLIKHGKHLLSLAI